ncbi:MAG: extracellular solute-binding protein [Anaerolinea sp.]|nr:extracellular solute-binding protein [Anaerolinea sp.]
MKNKNVYLLLIVMLMGALVLVACGGGETNEPVVNQPVEESVAEEPAVEEPAMEEPTAVPAMEEPTAVPAETTGASLVIWADDTRSAILNELAADFEAEYGVKLIVEEVANIRDQFTIAAPAGEGPDITLVPHDQAGSMVASGLLAPLDLGAKASLFVPKSIEGFTFDGELYGMPFSTENLGFFYNTELVPEPPTTWEELYEIGKALQEEGKVTYGLSVSGTTYDIYPLDTAFGGYIFGQDADGNWNPQDLGVDNEGMIAATQWLQDMVNEGFISDSTDWDTAHVLFETGETPFIMAGPWALDRIRAAGVPYAITNFPSAAQEGYPFAGVQGFIINAFSDNVLLAQAFLTEFVATDEVMARLYQATNRPSAYIPVLEATADEDLQALGEAGANASPMPAIPEMGSVWGSWNDGVVLTMQNQQTAEEAMSTAATQIRTIIGGAFSGMVNVPGSWQAAAGCPGDWQPDCATTALTEGADGLFTGVFDLPAGDYEAKVALDGSWTVNYGVDGVADGDNYTFSLTADGSVTFTYDPATNILTIEVK